MRIVVHDACEYSEVISLLKLILNHKDTPLYTRYYYAMSLQALGDHEQAEAQLLILESTLLNEKSSSESEQLLSQTLLAEISLKNGNHQRTEEIYQSLIKQFPQNNQIPAGYAHFLIEQNRYQEAGELLNTLLNGTSINGGQP